jgi:hypothetical protein
MPKRWNACSFSPVLFAGTLLVAWSMSALPSDARPCEIDAGGGCVRRDGYPCSPPTGGTCKTTPVPSVGVTCTCVAKQTRGQSRSPVVDPGVSIDIGIGGGHREERSDDRKFRSDEGGRKGGGSGFGTGGGTTFGR